MPAVDHHLVIEREQLLLDRAEEHLVLAATGESLAGVLDASDASSTIGVGVVEGPYGLIAVVVTAA